MEPAAKVATQAGYDAVAEEYAARFFDELAAKPLDRALLDCLVELTRGLGVIADMGCGPGQIARSTWPITAHRPWALTSRRRWCGWRSVSRPTFPSA